MKFQTQWGWFLSLRALSCASLLIFYFCPFPHFPIASLPPRSFFQPPINFFTMKLNPWTLFPGPLFLLGTFMVSFLLFRPFIWACFSEDIFRGFSGVWNHYQLLHWHGRNWEFVVQCCESCGVHVSGKVVERKPEFSEYVVSVRGPSALNLLHGR